MNNFGTTDMVSPLRRVLVKKPAAAMADADPNIWHYSGPLSGELLDRDHQALVGILEKYGAEVLYLEQDPDELADAVFTHDVSLVTPQGVVLCRMGKTLRRGEQ
ncbi:MAG: arginine deiminase-related protein, partial [Pirellulales bacterium]|nr:arginine deiminase-related protein [Pirellulales bacterium]